MLGSNLSGSDRLNCHCISIQAYLFRDITGGRVDRDFIFVLVGALTLKVGVNVVYRGGAGCSYFT